MKYLVGWRDDMVDGEVEPDRLAIDITGAGIARVWRSHNRMYSYSLHDGKLQFHQYGLPSMMAAIRSCKKQLAARGYEFISKERAEKLRLLL